MPRLVWLLLCLWLPAAHAGLLDTFKSSSEPEFLRVEQAFPLTTDIDDAHLTARWASKNGYYLYQHRIFITQGDDKLVPVAFSIPGIEKEDEAFGLVTAFYGELVADFDLSSLQPGTATLHHQGCADAGLCYPPQTAIINIPVLHASASATPRLSTTPLQPAEPQTQIARNRSSQSQPPQKQSTDSWFEGRSWWAVIGVFFILGLGLTFTPCVLPMVPILTSVVLGQGQRSSRDGFLLSSTYVLGMAITYAAAGLTVGLLGAGANVQAWMQAPWVLGLFAALFVALALSMFGLYELQLPSALRNRLNELNQKQSGGQWVSVFIMGVLSALVVSPCVSAPLAGALVYLGTTGDALLGGSALLALGLGMGAPLIVLGTTGASVLPKAGGWMNQIKAFFGVLLLGVAIWLVSRLLPGALSLALWGGLALVYGITLGALEPAANASQKLLKGTAWVIMIYGASALIGALQGNDNPLQPLALQSASHGASGQALPSNHAPFYQTASTDDIETKINRSNQLVMVDLYADWCISCKVMDKEIFAQADIQTALQQAMWLQLDITEQTEAQIHFLEQRGIFGPPTVLFYRDGKELTEARIVGELTHAEFAAHLQRNGLGLPDQDTTGQVR